MEQEPQDTELLVETRTSQIRSRNLRIKDHRVETRTSRIWSRNLRTPGYRIETRTSEYEAGTSGYRVTGRDTYLANMEQELQDSGLPSRDPNLRILSRNPNVTLASTMITKCVITTSAKSSSLTNLQNNDAL